MRMVSFLPAATEMVYALGLEDHLVGVSHECNHPPAARDKPTVVRGTFDPDSLTQGEIDAMVREQLEQEGTLYVVDEQRLRELRPDWILTQELCQVCAPSGQEVSRVLEQMDTDPEILWMSPHSIEGIFRNLIELGEAAGVEPRARDWVERARGRLEEIRERTETLPSPSVFCMEWMDPPFCSGHWVPEQVEIAGGREVIGRPGEKSRKIPWSEVGEADPEVLVAMPCGFGTDRAAREARVLWERPECSSVRAVVEQRVYAVDARAYFARPGPRVVEGTELLAHLFHPDAIAWRGPSDAFERLRLTRV